MTTHLAVLPGSERWRPTRAGVIGLWRYWDETFTFHRGRLLLRGANGSGKSMALELLLPFLLDADASPSRLTSAAKPRGTLFDRMMTGATEPSRVGFAWVEFHRGGETFTVGVRIRASQATRRADVDFFTTTLAVGRDLQLLDEARTPLSRKALAEAIGESGRVHASGDEHRSAVREVLFPGFGADRYGSVIGALLALRKEKLSQNLDLAKLSEVLSEALPPLDDHDIAAVAEGFERLDRRRVELAALEREVAEVRQLARHQRDYARAVVVGAAGAVRSAETRRDDVTRHERQAREEFDEARQRADALAAERAALEGRESTIIVEIEALKDSDAYRQGAALSDLRRQAARLADHAVRTRRAADERARDRAAADDDRARATDAAGVAEANLRRADGELRARAEAVGAEAVVDEAIGHSSLTTGPAVALGPSVAIASADAPPSADPDDGERLVQAWIGVQRAGIAEVRAGLEAHERAVAHRTFLDEQVAADEAAVDDRARARQDAAGAAEAAVDAYVTAVEEWAGGCVTIGPDLVRQALPHPPDEPRAVAAAVHELAAQLQVDDAVARRALAEQQKAAQAERGALVDERSRWEQPDLVDPEGPSWRSDRAGRAGAPLWKLVDVAAAGDAEVDGLEAALEGSGLLDAWVQPDGRVDLGAGRVDVVLTTVDVPVGRSLAALLRPAEPASGEPPVPAAVVAAVLASISVADTALHRPDAGRSGGGAGAGAEAIVAFDGTYRLGSAVGRGPVRPARLLGATARERHRLARLAELDAAIAAVDGHLAELARRLAAQERWRAAVDAELAAVPPGEAVDDSRAALAAAAARLAEAETRLDHTRAERRAAEDAVRAALRTLTTLAARHGLPAEREALADVEAGLDRLRNAAAAWARRARERQATERERQRAGERAEVATAAAERAEADAAEAEREAQQLEERVATLEGSIGAEYGELLRRVAALDGERTTHRRRLSEVAEEARVLERRLGRLEEAVRAAADAREAADAERDRMQQRLVGALRALAADGGVKVDAALDTATGVLAAARAIAAGHERVEADPKTVERLSERVRERVHLAQAALGTLVDLERELADDGWWVLRTTAGGIRRGVSELAESLAGQLAQGRAELAAEEERLFEQTLAGSVRRALAERIRQANALVDGINEQLAAIRTAAGGVQVRLRWEVDPEQPDAVRAARSLLLRDPADLTDGERASLQDFVRARVDQARSELEANAPWEARLRETLDYRAWHRFTLQLGHRDWEGFQPATARRLQKLSTGERSIALHLPMIASVAAHYAADDGRPSSCPRLILLDELFAGVDTANRAQLFGTFTAWDLDAVFTSDHEWCQYATLDGIAIHHLTPPSGDLPVTSTRFTWDGRQRRIDPSAA